jgi:hypothetical protein
MLREHYEAEVTYGAPVCSHYSYCLLVVGVAQNGSENAYHLLTARGALVPTRPPGTSSPRDSAAQCYSYGDPADRQRRSPARPLYHFVSTSAPKVPQPVRISLGDWVSCASAGSELLRRCSKYCGLGMQTRVQQREGKMGNWQRIVGKITQ